MDIIALLPIIFRLIELLPRLQATLAEKQSVPELVTKLAPDLLPILQQIGGQLFPGLSLASQASVGALAFDPDRVRWIQASMNKLTGSTLVVDGHYGNATKAAVTAFQQKHGLEPDGWAGNATSSAMEAELKKV